MNLSNKIPFFILILLKEFASTLTIDSDSELEPEHESEPEYDITKPLTEAIAKVFQCANPNSAVRLISHMKNNGTSRFEYSNTQKLAPFKRKIYLRNINISVWEPESPPKVVCNFKKNTMNIFIDFLTFNVAGFIDSALKSSYSSTCATFKTIVKFRGLSIAVSDTPSPYNKHFDLIFVYNQILYNHLTLPFVMNKQFHYRKKEMLISAMKSVMSHLIHEDLNHNEKFLHLIHSSYCYRPMQKLVSVYPNLLVNEDQHIYFIPKVTFFGVDLLNVKIKGLTNFDTLKPNATFGKNAYTLIVKKVRGTMSLDTDEFKKSKSYEMVFNIDRLCISVDYETRRLVVEARDYIVTQNNTNPSRPSVFSTAIMESIESAIGALIMPALQDLDSNEIDQEPFCDAPASSPEEMIETGPKNTETQTSTAESTTSQLTSTETEATPKASKSTWSNAAPKSRIITIRPLRARSRTNFSSKLDLETDQSSGIPDKASSNERTGNIDKSIYNMIVKKDNEIATKSTKKIDDDEYEYDISFHNVTIKLMPGTNYPSQISCGFFKNFKIDYKINAVPTGDNIRLNNKGNAVNINFHANFTSVEIAVENLVNGSKGNHCCEFQIFSNQDIKIIPPSKKNSVGESQDLQLKKEIDNTILSMVKERIVQTVRPIFCIPLKFCSQSVQILDDYFQGFVDKLLQKCSLRRNSTITT